MENIAVKVIYKGKIVIIGKGIRTQQSIINELQKRFNVPEQQIALFYLQYEDNSKDINQAYSNAYKQGKQSIRIKIQFLKPEERFIEMKSYHPVLPKENHQDLAEKKSSSDKVDELNKNGQKQQPHVVFEEITRKKVQTGLLLQTGNTKTQIESVDKSVHVENDSQNVLETAQKVTDDNHPYIPLVTQLTEDQMNLNQQPDKVVLTKPTSPSSLLQFHQADKISTQKIQPQQQQSEEESSLLQYSIRPNHCLNRSNQQMPLTTFVDYFTRELLSPTYTTYKRQKITYPDLQNKELHDDYEQSPCEMQHLNLYQNYSSRPLETQNVDDQPINKLRQQLRKQFDDKLMLFEKRQLKLEKNNEELQTKYNDLMQKYNALTSIPQQSMVKTEKQQDIPEKQHQKDQQNKPQIEGYEKLPNFDPFQHILNQEDQQTDEPKVEIKDLDNKNQCFVGQVIKPQFFIVNTGSEKWPENVVLVSQTDVIEIKSLEPNEEYILLLKEITVGKQDTQIRQKYALGFYNQKGQLKYFGHRFGVRTKVINKLIDGEILKQKHINDFIYYIHKLMIQNNIFGKDNKEVVNYLRSIGLNEKNYKQVDVAHMVDAINYME